ncbi:hypothetical protein CDL15_Pgr025986 [Punica granatum]|nr:hypothetical protein CDL15_Pgr025986 [Punica granatum]
MGDGNGTKLSVEKPVKARLPPKRGAVKVRILKLLVEKLVSLCFPPMADLREAGSSTSKPTSAVSPFPNK